jgi:hypothetical protein
MTYWLVFITFAGGMLNTAATPASSMPDCAEKLKIAAPYYPSNAILLCIAILPDRRKPQ